MSFDLIKDYDSKHFTLLCRDLEGCDGFLVDVLNLDNVVYIIMRDFLKVIIFTDFENLKDDLHGFPCADSVLKAMYYLDVEGYLYEK